MLQNYDEVLALVMREINDIVYLSDIETYELLFINHRAKQLLDCKDESDWMGKPCYKVLQNLDEPCPFCTNLYLKKNEFYCWEHYNQMLNRYFDVKDKLVEWNDRELRLEIAVDNTEKEKMYIQLKNNLVTEKTLVSCIRTLTMNSDLTAAINNLLEIIGDYYEGERAYIFECDYKNALLVNTYEWCKEGIEPQIDNLKELPLDAADRWMDAFREKGEFYISRLGEDVDKNSAEYEILEPQGVESLMAAPLMENDDIIGFIGVDNPSVNIQAMMLLQSVSFFVLDDIKKKKLTSQLTELSYKDTLTGIWNRNKYMEILDEFEHTDRPDRLGIIYADINGLKSTNDLHGHLCGDRLICRAAEILNGLFPDNVYRIGGDEFIILCPNISHQEFNEKVDLLYDKVNEDRERILSIGLKWSENEKGIIKQIVSADKLMYAEKQRYYSIQHPGKSSHKTRLSEELLCEIRRGWFFICLQPKIALQTGELCGAEALVRKTDSKGRTEMPIQFIQRYEVEGIIRYVDLFVLERVCQLLARWNHFRKNDLKIAVNMSRFTLMEYGITEEMQRICNQYGISTDRIAIEVTETMGQMHKEELRFLMDSLKKRGFSVSLDDFGAEYSNLAILVSSQFNEIKMDKSLMDNIVNDERAKIIATHAIALCKELNVTTSVAEGIEVEEQLKMLKELKCDVGQGYFFDKPLTVECFENKYIK